MAAININVNMNRKSVVYNCIKGKTVIVTGALGGIGKATCLAFAACGAKIVAVDLNTDEADCLEKKVSSFNSEILTLKADVSKNNDCEMILEKTQSHFGDVDILFNNAGITRRKDILELSENEWDSIINVNLKSIFLMSKKVLPVMLKKNQGSIINTASGWGINGGAKAAAYCASKGGVVLLTKAMAIDFGGKGIRVNCICPGDTETNMLINEAQQLGLQPDQLVIEGINRPLGRIGSPKEIADAVLYLASANSSFITGTALIVDGGGLAGCN